MSAKVPLRYRIKRKLMGLPPLLFWACALAGAVYLYFRQETGMSLIGIAEEVRYYSASETSGRVDKIQVNLHQTVTQGQIVASLDNSNLLLTLCEAKTELERMRLELGREEAMWMLQVQEQQTDQQASLRRFARDVENAQIEILENEAKLAENRIKHQGLELILSRSKALTQNELVPLSSYDNHRIEVDALEKKIQENQGLVLSLKKRHQEATARYEAFLDEHVFENTDTELLLKPLHYGIKAQQVRIEQVNLAIVNLVLRAPGSGIVSEILVRPGEVVTLGQPVVSILDPTPSEAVAYLPESRILDLKPGSRVLIKRKTVPSSSVQSAITALGGHVQELPQRLFPGITTPQWGRAVYVALPEKSDIKPGEALEILCLNR